MEHTINACNDSNPPQKTDVFFIVHNYNMVPSDILRYCKNYIVYDASTDPAIVYDLEKQNIDYRKIQNTGHNITTYFKYFIDNYDNLPEYMMLAKGHMIGRHCSRDFFERAYNNHYFTFLYEDAPHAERMNNIKIAYMASENWYCERNNDWYVSSPNHPHRYFVRYNDLLRFIYQNPVLPEYTLFAPGGCYIVGRDQVRRHTRNFYNNLNKIMNYGLDPSFPSEAHQIERMLPVIFGANYVENPWMSDETEFDNHLQEAERYVQTWDKSHKCNPKLTRRVISKLRKYFE